jgi:hypothetical protein
MWTRSVIAMHYELVEGRLVMTAAPANPHQMAGKRLERLLDEAALPEFEAMRRVSLRIGDDLLVPDVLVATAEVLSGPEQSVDPSGTVLVVEIHVERPFELDFDPGDLAGPPGQRVRRTPA